MNNLRRNILVCGGATGLLSVLGCASKQSTALHTGVTYDEEISSFFIFPKTNALGVVGKRNHYVFSDSSRLVSILGSTFRQEMTGSFEPFRVDWQNRIVGRYTISTNNKLSPEQRTEALKLGFSERKDGRFEVSQQLNGVRYLPADIAGLATASPLNQKYLIKVVEVSDPNVLRSSSPEMQGSPMNSHSFSAGEIVFVGVIFSLLVLSSVRHSSF